MYQYYFRNLYRRTMDEAYRFASSEIVSALAEGGNCLDCGAGSGHWYGKLHTEVRLARDRYFGIEWDKESVADARNNQINVTCGDLNQPLPYEDNLFSCVFGLSVIEHLLYPCRYIKECQRILIPGGKLVLLTPNISNYFKAFLILAGRMPSSGPHPDSEWLVTSNEVFKVSSNELKPDPESDIPIHRHLIVFSYSELKKYLVSVGFNNVRGHGFGLYPFPKIMQPFMEKIDPYHCHQMVFTAEQETK